MKHAPPKLHLASASPRRRDILTALGLTFTYAGVDADESRLAEETPAQMVVRLAALKARAASEPGEGRVILGADTAVALGDRIFDKPADEAEAVDILLQLSGRSHEVLTGVAVQSDNRVETLLSCSKVRFRDIDPAEASDYWHSGEPADKAGGYAIQGLGAVFVAELQGSYSGVVGLPVFETAAALGRAGVAVLGTARTKA